MERFRLTALQLPSSGFGEVGNELGFFGDFVGGEGGKAVLWEGGLCSRYLSRVLRQGLV